MRKRILIISGIIAVLLILAGCLYFFPIKITPIDITMDALKTGFEGEEMGTVQITVRGTLTEYLFHDDRISLEITPFEDLYDIEPWGTDIFNSTNIGQPDAHGYYSLECTASSTEIGEDSFILTIFFREDLSKWEFFRLRTGASAEPGYRDLDFTYCATVE